MKRSFKSYAQAEDAYRRANNDATVSAIALNALLNGEKIQKFRRGAYTARVLRADSAHGGIVLVTFCHPGQSDYTSAHYVTDWTERRHTLAPADDEARDVRDLMMDVVVYVDQCFNRAVA